MTNPLLTLPELQARLRVSRASVYRWLECGLPSVGQGRVRRFVWEEVLAWLRGSQSLDIEPVLEPGEYRCTGCGWIGGVPYAVRRSDLGPCPTCGGRAPLVMVRR